MFSMRSFPCVIATRLADAQPSSLFRPYLQPQKSWAKKLAPCRHGAYDRLERHMSWLRKVTPTLSADSRRLSRRANAQQRAPTT